MTTGSAELDDLLETFHYRLIIEQLPADGIVGLVHLLDALPAWLEELLEAQPVLAASTSIDEQWRTAAGALESAGERLFRQLEATT